MQESPSNTLAPLSPYDRYLVKFGSDIYAQSGSSTEISLDPESGGFTVSLMKCHDLTEVDRAEVPSLVKYIDPNTNQVSFYFYGLSEENKGKLTLLNDLSKTLPNLIDLEERPYFLLVPFGENSEFYQQIIQKKAHRPIPKQTIAASALRTIMDTPNTETLGSLIEQQNDPIALLLAISDALKNPEECSTALNWLAEKRPINDPGAAVDFAISQRNLPLLEFLEKRMKAKLTPDQEKKAHWLRETNTLQQQVKKSLLPEWASKLWYKKQSQQLVHEQSAFIREKGALFDANNQVHARSPIAAILSGAYYESEDVQKREALARAITEQLATYIDYQRTPLITPLIYLWALNMAIDPGGPVLTSQRRKYRPLEVIVTTDSSINGISSSYILSDKNGVQGSAPFNKNDLLVAFDDSTNIQEIMRRLFHEAAHLAASEVFQNDSKPYNKWDFSCKKRYQLLKHSMINKIDNLIPHNQKEALAINLFRNALGYEDEHIIEELFVKVTEAIVLLGYDEGLCWLSEHVPDLLELYANEFLPACMEYLKYRQVDAHLSLAPSFSDALQKTPMPVFSFVLKKSEAAILVLAFVIFVSGVVLAIINPGFLILGLAYLGIALIPPLIIAINFQRSIANRLAAQEREFEPPPGGNYIEPISRPTIYHAILNQIDDNDDIIPSSSLPHKHSALGATYPICDSKNLNFSYQQLN